MDYKIIYERLFQITKLAGIVALHSQVDVQNVGKQVDFIDDEEDHHKAMRQAKTRIDVMIQEMFLQELFSTYGTIISLDVEEDSESVVLYQNKSFEYTLVLDPIDGTLDYVEQADTYSICSAILHEHDVKVAIVYFPARDELYGYYEGASTLWYKGLKDVTYQDGKVLDYLPNKNIPTRIYKNQRLSSMIVCQLEAKGYEVIDDALQHVGCPDTLLKCMRGEGLAYFSDTRNIRDILLGAILCKMKHGHCYQYDGSNAIWESYGRQKEIVFSIYDCDELFTYISNENKNK